MERALSLIALSVPGARIVPGASITVEELQGRTPVLLIEVPGDSDETVLLYGHFDKQPEMMGWREGLDPWTPVEPGRVIPARRARRCGRRLCQRSRRSQR